MAVSAQTLSVGTTTAPTTTTPHATAITGYGNAPYEMTTYVPWDFTDVKLINLEAFVIGRYNNPTFLRTITAWGTTGDQTISKPAGTVNIAAGQASIVITNTLVTTSSIVLASVRTADATLLYIKSIVCTANTITITCNTTATAETSIGFVVFN